MREIEFNDGNKNSADGDDGVGGESGHGGDENNKIREVNFITGAVLLPKNPGEFQTDDDTVVLFVL